MSSHRAACYALLFACAGAWASASGDERRPPTYRIHVQIVELLKGGKEQVLSEPQVMTVEEQPAMVSVGHEATAVEIDDERKIRTADRIACSFTPYKLKGGGVKIDLEIEIVERANEMDDMLVARKFGVRRVQDIPLGVRVAVPFSRTGKKPTHRLDMTVTEEPEPAQLDDVPPPPPPKRPPVIGPGVFQNEDLRDILEDWERMWLLPAPDKPTPFRTHGGVI